MKHFSEFEVSYPPIKNIAAYFAHSSTKSGEPETLLEHIRHTRQTFLYLCERGLEQIINQQIMLVFNDDYDAIKQLVLDIICLHDIGKINPAFQIKIGNKHITRIKDDEDDSHSELGWLLFSQFYAERIKNFHNDKDWLCAWILTTLIASHHTFAWGIVPDYKLPSRENLSRAYIIARHAGWDLKESYDSIWYCFDERAKQFGGIPSQLFALYKTLYSALILADSTATAEAATGDAADNLEITQKDIIRWQENFSNTLHMVYYEKVKYMLEGMSPEGINDLNLLRSKILQEATHNLDEALSQGREMRKRLFYLEAPTGSGKTNCAINLALHTIEADKSIKHAIFVFPFVNLIEQNIDVLKASIGAEPGDVLEVHSLAEYGKDDENAYDTKKEIDQRIFLNGKISVISSVNFLESLGSSRKNSNYKICNISNSVVILDEIQSIDDTKWPYLAFLLDMFARCNNCYFILMSATLPKIDKLRLTADESNNKFVDLLPNSSSRYQNHSSFINRCKIELLRDINTVEELKNLIINMLKVSKPPIKLLVVVNTIRRSHEVFSSLPEAFETANGRRIFQKRILNSELLPHIKRGIITEAKQTNDNIILVSTQCIEAGVDVDFDIGIRDYAIPDSIEQVAGRINREGKKPPSILYVVNLKRSDRDDAEIIYGKGRRWATVRRMGDKLNYVFTQRDYTAYYCALTEYIEDLCMNSGNGVDIKGRTEVENARNLRLSNLRDFSAIENDIKESWFIPIEIPVSAFTLTAQNLIASAIVKGKVDGRRVWEEYQNIKTLRSQDGIIKMAIFSPILTRFIANRTPLNRRRPSEAVTFHEDWQNEYNLMTGFINSESIF